jgi:hypothetical protein
MATPKIATENSLSPQAQHIAIARLEASEHSERRLRLSLSSAPRALGVLIVRTGRFLSIFAASLIAMAPLQATAQVTQQDELDRVSVRDRPRPDYDPLGMRVGAFDLNAYVDLSVTQTDNLFGAEVNPVDDTIFAVSPYATLASRWSRHAMWFSGGATFNDHQDFSNEDAESGFVRAGGRLDIGLNTALTANAGLAHVVEPRTNPDTPNFGDPIEYEQLDYGVGLSHEFSRFRVALDVGHINYDYDAPQDFRDSDEDFVTGRIETELTPRIAAFGQVRFDERQYDAQPALSSEGREGLIGVSIDFTELMRGEIGIGQFEREYDSGASVDGIAVRGDLEWFVTRLTTINVNASRSAEDSGGIVVSPYVETEYGAGVDHELMRNLIVSAGVQTGRRDYEVIDREDDYTTVSADAEYLINRRFSLRGRVAHVDVESTGVNRYRTFDATETTLGLRIKL